MRTKKRGRVGARPGRTESRVSFRLKPVALSLPRRGSRVNPKGLLAKLNMPSFVAELLGIPVPTRRGWIDGGLCPFHDDKRRGSFWVHMPEGRFACFSCGARGDALDLLMKVRGLTFAEALDYVRRAAS